MVRLALIAATGFLALSLAACDDHKDTKPVTTNPPIQHPAPAPQHPGAAPAPQHQPAPVQGH